MSLVSLVSFLVALNVHGTCARTRTRAGERGRLLSWNSPNSPVHSHTLERALGTTEALH